MKRLAVTGLILGSVSFLFGLYLAWPPLAPIVGGLLLIGGCLMVELDPKRGDKA